MNLRLRGNDRTRRSVQPPSFPRKRESMNNREVPCKVTSGPWSRLSRRKTPARSSTTPLPRGAQGKPSVLQKVRKGSTRVPPEA